MSENKELPPERLWLAFVLIGEDLYSYANIAADFLEEKGFVDFATQIREQATQENIDVLGDGWAHGNRVVHYFREGDRISLCRRAFNDGYRRPNKVFRSKCKTCLKKLNQEIQTRNANHDGS